MERGEVYMCNRDGTIVEVLGVGAGKEATSGPLQCGGEDMRHLKENTQDAATEKHVPVIKPLPNGVKVVIGEVPHPMEPEHYIEWIELRTSDIVYRKYLKPGDAPEATFPAVDDDFYVLEHCNLHGLWKAEK